ncbi:MAG TPA: hypothetical protein VHV51_14365 [Polyangiaceae bacterium]|jgi:hypothetical protein|nr:hypothetical protein [Polyangiaceae bacterium]
MDELGPRARALLDAAEGADDPASADAVRVRAAVLSRIGSAGFGAALFSLSLEQAKAFLGAAVPKLATVALLAVGTSALYHHWREHPNALANASVPAVVSAPAVAAAPPVAPSSTSPQATRAPSAEPAQVRSKPHPLAKALQRDDLEAEMRLVRAADAALRAGDLALSQNLLIQHAREFPNGALAEEREGLRVIATCEGSATESTRRAANRFLQRAPRALIAGRIRAACAGLDEPEN